MQKFIKKYRNNILSFIIPWIILCTLFLCLFILVPKGNSILLSDMEVQYNNLLTYFKNHGFETFSFLKGLGGNMIGTFAYYLSSPLNLITLLFKDAKTDLAILLIITIKISLSGFTMFLFLKDEIKTKDEKYLFIFSTSYALMGFHVAYFFNMIWLDATYILPIVILGINHLFKHKPKLYIFALFYAIITNYYMGYMICIFSLLYFVYKLLLNYNIKKDKKEILKLCKRFIISSLLSVGLSLFFLLPTVLELRQISKNNISPYTNGIKLTNPLSVLSFIFIGARDNTMILSEKVYNLYFGTINLILLFFYFINQDISKKEKRLSFGIVFIFILSIFVNYVDYVWHAFTETSSFTARFVFLMAFFNLILSAKSFIKIKKIESKYYFIFLILFILASIITMFCRYSYINNYLLIANNVLVMFYLVLLYYLPRLTFKKSILSFLIIFLTFGELFFNFYMSIRSYHYLTRYEVQDIYNTFNQKVNEIKKEDKDFYRIAKNYSLTGNDAFRYNIPVASHFLSTIHNKTLSFLGYTSYEIGSNYASYYKPNPVIDSILGNKYIFLKSFSTPYYEEIDTFKVSETRYEYYKISQKDVLIYKNPYAFSLGTLVHDKTQSCTLNYNDKDLDRMKFQNQMIECLSGHESQVFEKVELEKIDKNKYQIVANGRKTLYLVPKIAFNYDVISNHVKLSVNGTELYDFDESTVVISNFEIDSDQDVKVIVELKNDDEPEKEYEIYAYYFNFEEYEKIFKDLSAEKMNILENNHSYIKGEVEVKDKNYLLMNTEYTDEWKIFVDGKEVKYDEVFHTFIGLKLDKGKHIIEMKFHPKGWKLGIILSMISLFVTIYYIKRN